MHLRVLHRFCLAGALAAFTALSSPAPAAAEPPAATAPAATPFTMPDTPAGRIMTRVLTSIQGPTDSKLEPLAATDLSEGFLKQVPFDQLQTVFASIREQEGSLAPKRVEQQQGQDKLVIHAEGAKNNTPLRVILGLDAAGKIETLLLQPAPSDEPALKDWADLDARLRELPGATNFAAYQVRMIDGPAAAADAKPAPVAKLAQVHGYRADQRLAIGSSFKLYVLGALAEAVQTGKARWDEKLAIKDIYKSLPSGKLQDEIVGREFPLSEYGDLMISISDNTATDHLIHRLGRESVEAYMATVQNPPPVNRPFLTTREFFALRLKPDSTLVERWLKLDEATRRDMLLPEPEGKFTRPVGVSHNPGEIAAWALDPGAAATWKAPRHIDKVEWFATAEECARVMADLARREKLPGMEPLSRTLRINPGQGVAIDTNRWTAIAFKGGSEPGVMNLTWLLTRDDGKQFTLTIGWNNTAAALDEAKLVGLAARAIEHLGRQP